MALPVRMGTTSVHSDTMERPTPKDYLSGADVVYIRNVSGAIVISRDGLTRKHPRTGQALFGYGVGRCISISVSISTVRETSVMI